MTNKMVFANNEELRQKILDGANTLADYVSSTLGPKGRTVLLKEKDKSAFATKDGVTVATFVHLEDPFENAAAEVIKQAAAQTNSMAGDGTTTATILTQAIVNEGLKYVTAGMNPMDIKRGIDKAVESVISKLKTSSKKVKANEEVAQVGTISANGEKSVTTSEILANEIGDNKNALLKYLVEEYTNLYPNVQSGNGPDIVETKEVITNKADFLVAYRVYDFGNWKSTQDDSVNRITYVKLHIRVVDMKTGEVLDPVLTDAQKKECELLLLNNR